jgi:hypothetical protein
MTAQEHYLEAERILAAVGKQAALISDGLETLATASNVLTASVGVVGFTVATAQVHATLALAAATGCAGNEVARQAWLDVAG